MSYQVLARKWRPRSFREMVGQAHVLKALINALDNQRLHHAYLFTGTRGVGKTTIARIIAKCLNCETGITSTPCGTCSVCREIDEGRFVDLIEIDAASRTKGMGREAAPSHFWPSAKGLLNSCEQTFIKQLGLRIRCVQLLEEWIHEHVTR